MIDTPPDLVIRTARPGDCEDIAVLINLPGVALWSTHSEWRGSKAGAPSTVGGNISSCPT
jgi:hypothetical protein